MNNNETSILPHTVTLPLMGKVEALSDSAAEIHGNGYPTHNILLDVLAIVADCTEYELELRINKEGFQLVFPQNIEADQVLDDFDRALEVLSETILDD
jgi:hypothetical protein